MASACEVGAFIKSVVMPEHVVVTMPRGGRTGHGRGRRTFARWNKGAVARWQGGAESDPTREEGAADDAAKGIRYTRRDYVVPGECKEPSYFKMVTTLVAGLFGSGTPTVVYSRPKYMGPKRGPDDEPEAPLGPLEFKRLADRQYSVESDTLEVAAAWRGGSGQLLLLRVEDGSETSRTGTFDPYGRTTCRCPSASEGMSFDLVVEDADGRRSKPRRINVVAPGSAPAPDGELAGAQPAIEAAWLYYHGGEQWKLEALSRLARLRRTDLIALQAWRHATTDDIP